MRLSHSKLATLLKCPMTYYLTYEQGIYTKVEKPALAIGSAVHWGIEHNTEDLSEYYKENGTFKQGDNFTRDQLLAEAMVHGYMKHKDELFDKLLTDPYTGEKLTLLEENHELYLTGKLKSLKHPGEFHDFVGIIDLLLLTDKGFVLVDYKTSSYEPDWNNYLEQLYRYIFELRENFPDVPIVKIAIINIRKTNIRQKKNENEFEFLQRMKFEYDINDESYVNYHEYMTSEIDDTLLNNYIDNLSKMADTAKMIVDNKMWFINYGAANDTYGKSQFYDIFYHTPGCEALYNIVDDVYDFDEQAFVKYRPCVALDMQVIDRSDILNKYKDFEQELLKTDAQSKDDFFHQLAERYSVDKTLLELYWLTYIKKKEVNKNAGQQS